MTQSRDAAMQWQVTCQCGWRTHGTREQVIPAVKGHGKQAHGLEVSDEDVMALAVPAAGG
ncbi:MAG: DUF1059 domain-containing protein [Dehalococcoidia bacterium]|nr:DUF1059 domain-containing protein [Dehalococcoidia bacterium]